VGVTAGGNAEDGRVNGQGFGVFLFAQVGQAGGDGAVDGQIEEALNLLGLHAPGTVGELGDGTLGGEISQVLDGGVLRGEAKAFLNGAAGRRDGVLALVAAQVIEDLLLAFGKHGVQLNTF